ncbi:MAG: SCP2 sterol-binding domain-containing protein, partial [Ruminococcus sp.]
YYDRDCTFVISAENFFKICDGSLDAVKAFTVGKLKVLGNIDKALKFSGIVKSVREQSENKKSKKKSK